VWFREKEKTRENVKKHEFIGGFSFTPILSGANLTLSSDTMITIAYIFNEKRSRRRTIRDLKDSLRMKNEE